MCANCGHFDKPSLVLGLPRAVIQRIDHLSMEETLKGTFPLVYIFIKLNKMPASIRNLSQCLALVLSN